VIGPTLHRAAASLLVALALACSNGRDDAADPSRDSAADVAPVSATAPSAAELTGETLDALERGLRRETQLVRDASARSSSATTPEERGRALQDGFPDRTIPIAAAEVGMSAPRYRAVRETVGRVLTALDFQGKIDGPMSVDTANADAALRARLTSDPFAELTPRSADALRARMDRLVPVWIEYVNLTAVGG
jgi:hypothetical protein